ncbi:NAD-dependent malic enzyme [Streptomyces avermitilis]|uniref:Malolactic enzyme n=2 Tax=Streptomyces avermitilis TaxID=33903 RepID=Q82GM7_STRAW|nr:MULTISPECIES: NAD-dependent malic enzyme [Streptomyces]KUN57001.1 NAD-dependent malic enzyme [Streptomyces avermitilis]MYS99469.1 oxaloacetate-decarboxylating malate dehydrogenase [Streptomyces sp. SID5469]OOV32273.1 NAD-dependent malic enzyme [Streptomyces avermitilis]BAC71582.1 putative malate dehydrogenase (oxaloacetate-decarboxylating; NAD-requiring) [Streptomyces avermitilis MA-4680 = NBRC 14893]BBJ51815.1 putative NAD-dependent malic enzyme 3 [Streptomyces avermitilis]
MTTDRNKTAERDTTHKPLRVTARGRAVLADPRLNRGTAFTDEERRALGLVGLVPPRVLTQDEQADRAYAQFREQPGDLAKNVYLTALHDRNEVLFYRLVGDHLEEMLPIVYTPTVGTAIKRYSYEYRRPRGIYLSVNAPDDIERSLRAAGLGADDVDLIVATDGEGILGIGDWGVGGIDIAVGKLAVYTAAAGVDPRRTLPVMLDVGTNRQELLDSPLYLGNRHPRVDRDTYDAFIDAYVTAATKLFPRALLHWEDFGPANARRIFNHYRDDVFTFNDDIQGTGAVNLAAVLSGAKAGDLPLRDHRIVVLGAGSAGIGVADQLRDALVAEGLSSDEATARFWCVDRYGLLTADQGDKLRDFQVPYARPADEVSDWQRDDDLPGIPLDEVVRRVHPTILIGTSGQGGAFTETVVREMAAHTPRPIILPMSNPTDLAEAKPADLLAWTDGKALVATGSPFDPVELNGTTYRIGQANNALIFPGLGLGAIVARATRVTDRMLRAAADAVANQTDVTDPGAPVLPPVRDLRETSFAVAVAVARAAAEDDVARAGTDDIEAAVRAVTWEPVYPPVQAV